MDRELVIFVGLQASGKTSFYRSFLKPTHTLVSKDSLRSKRERGKRQQALIRAAMSARQNVVVDKTNPPAEDRRPLIDHGNEYQYRLIAVYFDASIEECMARNALRVGRDKVPEVGLRVTSRLLVRPAFSEGYHAVLRVRPLPGGDFETTDVEEDENGWER